MAEQITIPEGDYLAIVTDFEVTERETGVVVISWKLLINMGNPDKWDRDARTIPFQHYTYIGKRVYGVLTDTSNAFKTAEFLHALDVRNSIHDERVAFRQIIVSIEHRPDSNGNIWPRISRASQYIVDGEVAPILNI